MDGGIETIFVEANGLRFEVQQCGTGDRLALCLHGFPEHAHSWRYQLPLLSRLGYRAWAPNLRGYGNTSRPPAVADYRMDNLLADVAGLIDASGARETVLIAHDWGGAIAWMFALRKVRPLARFIVMNLPHPALMMRGLGTWAQLKRSWYIFFFQIPGLPERLFGAEGARRIGDVFRDMAIDKSRFTDDVLEVYRANARAPGALTAMINYYRAAVRGGGVPEAKAGWPVLETPTLMIWGEEDSALGKELTYGTDAFVRDLTLRYVPRCSHWVQQEQPEIVNALVEAWLTGQPVPEVTADHRLVPLGTVAA
jgi:pimeloyl-ACP methyl ester carboxylesterase